MALAVERTETSEVTGNGPRRHARPTGRRHPAGGRRAGAPALTLAALATLAALSAGCTAAGTAGGPAAPVPEVGAVGQPAPAGTGSLAAVACGSPADCWAVGAPATNVLAGLPTATTTPPVAVIDRSADGGASWTAQRVPVADPTDLDVLACPDRAHCMAVGSADDNGPLVGAVLTTDDGGRAWRAVAAPADAVDLSAVACTTGSDCMVMATDGSSYWSAVTTDGGSVWQRQGQLPAGFGGISTVLCTTPQDCMSPGYLSSTPGRGSGAVAVTTDGGTTWTAASVPAGTGLLHGVACPAPARCIAVGTKSTTDSDVAQGQGQLLVSADAGATWSPLAAPAGIDDAFAISCPTGRACAVVGTVWTPTNPPTPIGGVVATADAGASWAPPPTRYIPSGLTDVDCTGPTSCVAAGNDVLARIALPAPRPARAVAPAYFERRAALSSRAMRAGDGSASRASSRRMAGSGRLWVANHRGLGRDRKGPRTTDFWGRSNM